MDRLDPLGSDESQENDRLPLKLNKQSHNLIHLQPHARGPEVTLISSCRS